MERTIFHCLVEKFRQDCHNCIERAGRKTSKNSFEKEGLFTAFRLWTKEVRVLVKIVEIFRALLPWLHSRCLEAPFERNSFFEKINFSFFLFGLRKTNIWTTAALFSPGFSKVFYMSRETLWQKRPFLEKIIFICSFPEIKQRSFGLLAKIVWQGCQMHSTCLEKHSDKRGFCQKGRYFFQFRNVSEKLSSFWRKKSRVVKTAIFMSKKHFDENRLNEKSIVFIIVPLPTAEFNQVFRKWKKDSLVVTTLSVSSWSFGGRLCFLRKMFFFQSISDFKQKFWTFGDKLTEWLSKLHSTLHKNAFEENHFWKVSQPF